MNKKKDSEKACKVFAEQLWTIEKTIRTTADIYNTFTIFINKSFIDIQYFLTIIIRYISINIINKLLKCGSYLTFSVKVLVLVYKVGSIWLMAILKLNFSNPNFTLS